MTGSARAIFNRFGSTEKFNALNLTKSNYFIFETALRFKSFNAQLFFVFLIFQNLHSYEV